MRIHVATKKNRYGNCKHPHIIETEDGLFCKVCGKQIPYIDSYDDETDLYDWSDLYVDPEPELKPNEPPHWMWRFASNGWADHICSRCGWTLNTDVHVQMDYKHCPECGIKMTGM